MKTKITLGIMGLFLAGNSISQISTATLDQNNCSALLSDIGQFFNNPGLTSSGYEVPAGSGQKAIFSASMWFGGLDINGQLKLAATTYYPSQDLWPGALTNDGTATVVTPNPLIQTLWIVTKAQIDDHINNYQNPGYVIPGDILNWPAHGDVAQNQDYYLAPYVDIAGNGIYEPENGDYPCIKGDEAVYSIVNDMGAIHSSGGDPIGLEVHYMFYQFSSIPGLEDITFIDAHVINRGTQTLYDFTSTFFTDTDLGNATDDFMGSDSTRNLMYVYNADNNDENNSGNLGYGVNPPALGIVCLSENVSSIGTYTNGAFIPYTDPQFPSDFYNLMSGYWTNGTEWTDNNGQGTNFMFNGDPNDPLQWSEVSAMNPGGDRRMIMSLGDTNGVFQPWEEYDVTYAVVYAQGADHLSSVTELFQVTDFVQNFYASTSQDCYGGNLGLSQSDAPTFLVYPNPSNGNFVLDLKDQEGIGTVTLLDMSGRIVAEQALVFGGKVDFVTNASPGVYVIRVTSGRGDVTLRVVVE